MIEFSGVTKSFGSSIVLSDVSFTAGSGRVTGLVGHNGSGKTTLMRLISTLLRPTSGAVRVDGFNTVTNNREVRKRIGLMLGGDSALYDRLTARENIHYFARLQGVDRRVAMRRIETLAETFNMSDYLDQRVARFSRGMRQKVSLLRTIIHDPDYIVLDEPSTGLDLRGIEEVQSWVEHLIPTGKTFLISSHNLSEIDRLCQDLIILTGTGVVWGGKADLMQEHGSTSLQHVVADHLGKGWSHA